MKKIKNMNFTNTIFKDKIKSKISNRNQRPASWIKTNERNIYYEVI